MTESTPPDIRPIPASASLLGESPLWHPQEQALYWCDIPGRKLNRYDPASQHHDQWPFETEVACCAAFGDGGLLLALRTGLVRFDPATGARRPLADAPYDPDSERFNDGKTDPRGRFWVGTIYEPRDAARAALYRFDGGRIARMDGGITNSNGLAWSPDGGTLYWTDTSEAHIRAFDFDADTGSMSNPRTFARFPAKDPSQDLVRYGGRPDGAAVDEEGAYWVAMFEGARLLRLSPVDGSVLQEIALPVRCPTMPCFGGPGLRTLYVTTSRENRPADELAREPLAGRVLALQAPVAGLPVPPVTR